MNGNTMRWTIGGIAVLAILLAAVAFTVRERHAAIVTRFGKPVRVVLDAGLHWKLPWPIERAAHVDRRSRVLATRHTEMLTRDKKNVILLSYAVWSVEDPLVFHRAVGTLENGDQKLDGLVTNAKIGALGRHDLAALVSTDPATLRLAEIESEIEEAANAVAVPRYGIRIVEVGLQRLSLPEENITQVFNQMRAERRQYAARFRAEGQREAARIRAETDLERARILAESKEQSARIRGEADAEAARIYAAAHRLDPELYRFVRQLESLEQIIGKDSTVILRTDSEPFGLLKSKTP